MEGCDAQPHRSGIDGPQTSRSRQALEDPAPAKVRPAFARHGHEAGPSVPTPVEADHLPARGVNAADIRDTIDDWREQPLALSANVAGV